MSLINKFKQKDAITNLFFVSILFLPISLVIGSAFINSNIIIIDLIFLYFFFFRKKNLVEERKLIILLAIFLLLLTSLIFFSINIENSLVRTFGFLRHALLVISLVYAFKYLNKENLKLISQIWFVFVLIVSIDLLVEFFLGYNSLGFKSYMPGRLVGFMQDELKIGNLYIGLASFMIGYSMNYYPKNNILLISLVILVITISFLIGERANFIRILLITYIVLNLHFFLNKKKNIIYFNIILATILILFASLVSVSSSFKVRYYYQLILPIKENGLKDYIEKSIYGKHYNAAYKIFNENKLTGVGLKNFRVESFKLDVNQDQLNKKFLGSTHPHQIHLEFLAETGIVGYLGWIIFIILSIIYSAKTLYYNFNYFTFCGLIYVAIYICVPLPTGSFFSSYPATIFWLNYSLMMTNINKKY